MTRRNERPRGAARPSARDPYGVLLSGGGTAAILSAIGLLIVAVFTLGLFTGQLPIPSTNGSNGGGDAVSRTPAPSNVVVVDPRSNVPGSIVYVKTGNLWIQSGATAKQITSTGHDSMPSWSPDGQWIYFIETRTERGLFPSQGRGVYYDLTYPLLTRVHPDGSGRETILSGKYSAAGGKYQWFYWIRQPAVSPDGRTIALVSDGPDPTRNDVVLQLYDIASGKMTQTKVPENAPLGHQDPAWSPGTSKQLLYVKNGHDGARGTPSIWQYDVKTGRTVAVTGPGYLSPAWSPDGRYIAATKTTTTGTDVVILDPKDGSELLRVTTDGRAWAPVWSPAGDSIAFFHLEGGVVDLRTAKLAGTAPSWSVSDTIDLTQYSGLDGASHASWYVPKSQLPASTQPGASHASGGSSSSAP